MIRKMPKERPGQRRRCPERDVSGKAGHSMDMEVLTLSTAEWNQSREQAQKIINTINEMTVQVNLLALNAAVETVLSREDSAGFRWWWISYD